MLTVRQQQKLFKSTRSFRSIILQINSRRFSQNRSSKSQRDKHRESLWWDISKIACFRLGKKITSSLFQLLGSAHYRKTEQIFYLFLLFLPVFLTDLVVKTIRNIQHRTIQCENSCSYIITMVSSIYHLFLMGYFNSKQLQG